MSVLATPGYDLIPSAERVAVQSNYLTNADFDFMNQYVLNSYYTNFREILSGHNFLPLYVDEIL